MKGLFDYFLYVSVFPKQSQFISNFLDAHYEVVGELWSARAKIIRLEAYIALLEGELRRKYGR